MKGLKIVKSILFVVVFLALGMGAGVIVSNQLIESHNGNDVSVNNVQVNTEQITPTVETEELVNTEVSTEQSSVTESPAPDPNTDILDYIEWCKENPIDMTDYTVEKVSEIPEDYWSYKQAVDPNVPTDTYYPDMALLSIDHADDTECIIRANQITVAMRNYLGIDSFVAWDTSCGPFDWWVNDLTGCPYCDVKLDGIGTYRIYWDGDYVYIKNGEDIVGRRNQ